MIATTSRSLLAACCLTSSCAAGPSRLAIPPSSLPLRFSRPFSVYSPCHSGHNRWSKIRHKKGAADMQRAAIFSRLTQDIYNALKPPNGMDPNLNPRLAAAVAKAREAGVTKVAIEGVFAKARSVVDGTGQNMVFEALGPAGKEAFIIQCVTDNVKRTSQSLRKILMTFHCRITPVSFLFEKKGIITIVPPTGSSKGFDELFDIAVEGGAEDVKEIEGEEGVEWEIYTQPNDLGSLTNLLSDAHSADFPVTSSEIGYVPIDPLAITDDEMGISEDKADMIMRASDQLEEDPDVVKVWTNLA